MASIFKRAKGRNEPYVIQYFDHLGKRRTKIGFTDKGLTEELAAKLETEARLRATGLVDVRQERFAEHGKSALVEHVEAFEVSLGNNSSKHIQLTMTRVRRIIEACGFQTLADIDGEPVERGLAKLRKEHDLGHRTYNHYLQAFDAFCNWCVSSKRLIANPIVGLERLNTEVDVRHPRRALTADEVSQLLHSARSSGRRIQSYNGERRARLYLLSYMTGLRKKEIASLSPRSFSLGTAPATVTIEAACSKHRRKDVLPLHPELVRMLGVWMKGLQPSDKLFPRLAGKKTWLMVRKDLERVGIAYENEDGIADFHAAGRHTHITELLRNGATLPEAKELARHSDVKMTMKYTHIGLGDQAKAVANLPAPRQPEPAALAIDTEEPALHMRCSFCSAACQPVTCAGSEGDLQERHNPCRSKGYGVGCQHLAAADKVEAAGIEAPPESSGKTSNRRGVGPKSGPVRAPVELIEVWQALDAEGRAELLDVARRLVDQARVVVR